MTTSIIQREANNKVLRTRRKEASKIDVCRIIPFIIAQRMNLSCQPWLMYWITMIKTFFLLSTTYFGLFWHSSVNVQRWANVLSFEWNFKLAYFWHCAYLYLQLTLCVFVTLHWVQGWFACITYFAASWGCETCLWLSQFSL